MNCSSTKNSKEIHTVSTPTGQGLLPCSMGLAARRYSTAVVWLLAFHILACSRESPVVSPPKDSAVLRLCRERRKQVMRVGRQSMSSPEGMARLPIRSVVIAMYLVSCMYTYLVVVESCTFPPPCFRYSIYYCTRHCHRISALS